LLVLAALAIGRTVTRNYYYVANYNGTVSIMQGLQVSILGVALHQPYAQGCLNNHNQLSLIRYGHPGDTHNCQPMKLSDLAESARAQVAAGLPVGTLEQANTQLRRLSSESLLPPCPPARGKSPPTSTTQAPPTTTQTPEPDAGTPVPEEPSGGPSATMAEPNLTTLPPPPPQPGTECRAAA
jgi:protein phosphatase